MRRVLALLCGVTLLGVAGCAVPGGVEVEGRASQVSPPPSSSPLPVGTPVSADPVAILRADSQIDPKLKSFLQPCEFGDYPIDDRYVDLTGDGVAELVVTLNECPTKLGLEEEDTTSPPRVRGFAYAGYVYDLTTKPPTRLFGIEDAGVLVTPAKDGSLGLLILRNFWGPSDDPCCPTAYSELLYRWDGTTFVEENR
jgi:hypothetical protein